MSFCKNCGNKLIEGAEFCTNCGNPVVGSCANRTVQQSLMYEEFTPKFGIGSKRFAFTKNSLIHGKEEYPYSQLSPIILATAATTPLTNGVAQTTVNGITLMLAYSYKDNERFGTAMTYANEQIDLAHGNIKKYKYILQSPTGSKLEVYDDYLMLYYMPYSSNKGSDGVEVFAKGLGVTGKGLTGKLSKGVGKAFDGVAAIGSGLSNTMKGSASGNIILFVDLSIQMDATTLFINEYSIPIGQHNLDLAKEIITYIEGIQKSEESDTQSQLEEQNTWEPVKCVVKTFSISDKTFEVPENMDAFNTYRKRFQELAFKCADRAESEYRAKVHNLMTFIEFFPKIYIKGLDPIIKMAINALLAENIWTETYESFIEQHLNNFHHANDDYETMIGSVNLTSEANQQATAALTSLVPNLIGGGFGLKGAAKGIASAAAFNLVRDGIESSVIKGASNIKPEQQAELYNRIDIKLLFHNVFLDYWSVYITLVSTLKQGGKDIWIMEDNAKKQADNIFRNLSNPNFPQEKVLDVIISIMTINPYNKDYYKFIVSRFGETKEISVIKEYFGYTGSDPRIL